MRVNYVDAGNLLCYHNFLLEQGTQGPGDGVLAQVWFTVAPTDPSIVGHLFSC